MSNISLMSLTNTVPPQRDASGVGCW